eukprot:6180023-Pleurochrysis_carterae.AAC.2
MEFAASFGASETAMHGRLPLSLVPWYVAAVLSACVLRVVSARACVAWSRCSFAATRSRSSRFGLEVGATATRPQRGCCARCRSEREGTLRQNRQTRLSRRSPRAVGDFIDAYGRV